MEKPTSPDSNSQTLITVIMACHNRALKTERFFQSFRAAEQSGFKFEFVITNDGSTDQTQITIDSQPFQIKVHHGNGNLYWAKSMAKAEQLIQRVPDGFLWVNDDLILYPDAFEKLQSGIAANPKSVLVGQVEEMNSGGCVYGGYRRVGRHPLVLKLIYSERDYEKIDTFNGNFVFIPAEARLAVGPIDSNFAHAYADCDYGYRVQKSGYEIKVLPGFIGKTEINRHTWPSGRIGKIKQLLNVKFNPIQSQFRFFYTHRSRLWLFEIPIYIIRPFLKILLLNETDSLRSLKSAKRP